MSKKIDTQPSWKIPQHLAEAIAGVNSAVEKLQQSINNDKKLNFTLDGHFVGDIGEALAAHFFEITLNTQNEKGHDATMKVGRKKEDVEIKMRRKSTNIWFRTEPTHLIVFRMDENDSTVTLVYAGPGDVIRKRIRCKKKGKKIARLAQKSRDFTQKQDVSINMLSEEFKYEEFMESPSIPFRHEPEIHTA